MYINKQCQSEGEHLSTKVHNSYTRSCIILSLWSNKGKLLEMEEEVVTPSKCSVLTSPTLYNLGKTCDP